MAFTTYQLVTTDPTFQQQQGGTDYAALLQWGPAVSRHSRIIYGQYLPYPFAPADPVGSVAVLWQYRTAAAMDALLAGVPAALNARIPSGSSTEMVILDIENWPFTWDYTSADQKAAWPGTPTQYNDTARAYVLGLLERCRAHRPHCRWGIFDTPYPTYANYTSAQRAASNNMGWVFNGPGSVDFVCGSFYSPCETIAGTADNDAAFSSGGHTKVRRNRWLDQLTQEMRRMAAGKEFYVTIYPKVHRPDVPAVHGNWLTLEDIENYWSRAKQAGAEGIFVWDDIGSVEYFNTLQAFIDDNIKPAGGCVLSFA